MIEWRVGRGWSEDELEERLERIRGAGRNFAQPPETLSLETGWHHYYSEAIVAQEEPGPPGPRFRRGTVAIAGYQFSDPSIVTGHFDPLEPLLGRPMLLELKVLGLHYLCGVRVGATRTQDDERESVFGFRYDTLEGHIERGSEWFLLTKTHGTGEIRFRIDAYWTAGQFPNGWSRLGFHWIGPRYQRSWHRRAHPRLHLLMNAPEPHLLLPPRRLAHTGVEVTFKLTRGSGVRE